MDKAAILGEMRSRRISAIVRTENQRLAADAIDAVIHGGFRMVEFTLTTPGALELIAEYSRRDGILVGAGTVMRPGQVEQVLEAGASFVVAPTFNPDVVQRCVDALAVSVPGVYTPNEMLAAHEAGADLLKLFPRPSNIPEYVSSILGPLPHLKIWPTAGVNEENFIDILNAGAFGMGFVRSLFRPFDMEAGDMKAIEERARSITGRLSRWQAQQA